MAVSTRNPLHVVAGDNDYRSVDIPGLPNGQVAGDAWLGFFQSLDGGQTWTSTLVPGYPQDTSVLGTNLPLHGFQAGTDPVMRAGTNGMFYYAGLVFNRTPVVGGNFGASAIVVSRYIDNNSSVNPIQFLDSSVVAQGAPPTGFTDKPWIAVDIPRAGATQCVVNAAGQQQSFPGGNVYVTYTNFQNDQLHGAITFQRSTDCGVTWGAPIQFTDASLTRQGTAIAVDPNTGAVYVAWRQFSGVGAAVDAIYIVKSTDGGRTFSAPQLVAQITPFDQGSTQYSFRTNSYPALIVDGNGLVYVAWAQRGVGPGGDARIVVSTSPDLVAWTGPNPVDNQPSRGHQLMPALTFAGGTLMAAYYDLRQDSTEGIFTPVGGTGGLFTEMREQLGDLLVSPATVFSFFVDDTPPRLLRHEIEVWGAQAAPAAVPVFQSVRVSNFEFGSWPGAPDPLQVQQLQVDPPNFPMFAGGTQAYIGDYIDVAALQFVQNAAGAWIYNTAPANDTVFHFGWTDNRDVRPPADGNWAHYTPVPLAQFPGQVSLFDNTQNRLACVNNQEGMRNQNIYTANVTQGLVTGAPTNAKALGSLIRAFPITVENTSSSAFTVRLTVLNQPPGGRATFSQATSQPVPTLRIDVTVPPHSTISRSVFASSSQPQAQVRVSVQQITGPNGSVIAGGLQSIIVLNPDSTDPNLIPGPPGSNNEVYTPTIANPNIANPNIANPNIANPNIANPNIANPNIANPNIANPNIANPNIANPNIANPNIANPNIANPNIANPNIANPNITPGDVSGGTFQDLTWNVTNTGNSAMAYTIKTLLNGQLPPGFITQLIVSQAYTTPVASDCTLGLDVHTKLLTNITNPVLEQANANDASDPAITNSAINDPTVSLGPGESASLTIRIVNPDKTTNTNFNPLNTFIATVTSHGANNASVQQGNLQPPVAASQVIILNQALANAALATPYSAQLLSTGAAGAVTWSSNNLPANGLSLNSATGVISGTPTAAVPINITITAQDTGSPNSATRSFTINVASPPAPLISTTTLAVAYPSTPYNFTLIASGGAGAKTWAITAGALPTGLFLNASTGAITGLAVGTGSSNFTVTATDALSRQASKAFTLQVAPLTLSFVQQPASGNAFQQDPVQVKAVNGAGTGISGVIVTIQVILPNHNLLTSLVVVTGAGGIASTNISINQPGVNYTLIATSVGVAPVTSAPFTIAAIGSVPKLLVADGSSALANGSLIQVAADGSSATVTASTGGCPASVALDSSANRFIADPCSDSILEVTPGGVVSTFFTGAPLQNPVAVAVDLSGNIIVGDDSTDTVYRINSAGDSIVSIAALSPSPANLQDIAMVVDSAGNVIVANDDVTSPGVASELLKITPGGAVTTIYRGTVITSTTGLVIDSSGNYIIASPLQSVLFSVSPQASIKVVTASPALSQGLTGLAMDAFGNFYTALNTVPGLLEITPAGETISVFSGPPLTAPNALVILP